MEDFFPSPPAAELSALSLFGFRDVVGLASGSERAPPSEVAASSPFLLIVSEAAAESLVETL